MNKTKECESHLQAGLGLIAKQKYKVVHANAIEMIAANVKDAVPYCLLATIAAEHGNHIKACELFERAAKLEPENAHYQAYLGKALTTLGHQNLAKKTADKAAVLPLDNAFVADTIGVIYSRTGFHEQAITFFRAAVSMNPKPANFYYNLAASLQFLGKFEDAELALKQTLDRDPTAYRALSSLVGLKRQTKESNFLPMLKQLFKKLSNNEDATLHLGHAIAKTLEDLGKYKKSLEWLGAAKQGKIKSTEATAIKYKSLFEASKRSCFTGSAHFENEAIKSPIFIIGLPRTGTTMVDRILSSHTRVVSAGELNIFPGLIKQATQTGSNLVMDEETLEKATALNLSTIGQAYLKNTEDLSRGSPHFTDKMPLNFFYAGLIHQALPNAKIIALRRGAMDSCVSNYRQLLTVQHSYYQYTYKLEDIANFYLLFDDLMKHYRVHLPANRFMEIYYEDIVYDQETHTRRLLEYCGLQWEEACMRFHENTAPVSTASSVQVRRPLYSSSIGRWKRYGDRLDTLKVALGPLAD